MVTKAVSAEIALIVVSGTANRYILKTSTTVSTYLYDDDANGPRMSICKSAPEKNFNIETSCCGVLSLEGCACFICGHVEQFLMYSAVNSTLIGQ